jgi:hypothetical protein
MNQNFVPAYGYAPAFAPQGRPVAFNAPGWYGGPQMPLSAPASPQAAPAPAYAVQPVTRKEEALAVIADPMSAGVLMPDLDHGRIYVKRFNPNTGTSDFAEFSLAAPQAAQESAEQKMEYVTMDEFKRVVEPLAKAVAALRGGTHDE